MENAKLLDRILVIDDDVSTRMLLRATVAQWGYSVIEAVDGLDGLIKLQEPDAPKLVLVDWMMPNLDGIGFCQRAKKEIQNPPYIILLTSVSGASQMIKALDAGADEFLAKPFNPAELRGRVRAGFRIINYEYGDGAFSVEAGKIDQSVMRSLSELSQQLEESLDHFSQHMMTRDLKIEGKQSELVDELQQVLQHQKKMATLIQSIQNSSDKK